MKVVNKSYWLGFQNILNGENTHLKIGTSFEFWRFEICNEPNQKTALREQVHVWNLTDRYKKNHPRFLHILE